MSVLSDHRKHSDPHRPRTNPVAEYDAGYTDGWWDGFGTAVGTIVIVVMACLVVVGTK